MMYEGLGSAHTALEQGGSFIVPDLHPKDCPNLVAFKDKQGADNENIFQPERILTVLYLMKW